MLVYVLVAVVAGLVIAFQLIGAGYEVWVTECPWPLNVIQPGKRLLNLRT